MKLYKFTAYITMALSLAGGLNLVPDLSWLFLLGALVFLGFSYVLEKNGL